MDELARARGGPGGVVGALDQRHAVAARGRVERHAGAGDPAADDQDVERLGDERGDCCSAGEHVVRGYRRGRRTGQSPVALPGARMRGESTVLVARSNTRGVGGDLLSTSRAADAHQVPAGGALAVDRVGFSAAVTRGAGGAPERHHRPRGGRRAAAGGMGAASSSPPARSPRPALAEGIRGSPGAESLAFFDAIAPIVHRDSIDMDVAWFQSRYDKAGPGGTGADYLNCPMDREQYEAFVAALVAGDKIEFKEWEAHALFRRLPADRGHGRARPRDPAARPDEAGRPHQPARPEVKAYAIVQLRQDNALGTLYNMVGFQTKLNYAEQVADLPHHPRPGAGRVRPARRPAPQHLSRQPAPARRHAAAEGRARACASPARSPAARAMSRAPRSG